MNPLNLSGGAPELGVGFNDSLGEVVQRKLHDAHVVKALNSITCSQMINPQFEEGIADMLIAGNDVSAKSEVTEFLSELGWRVIDMGDISESRLLEPFAMIWIKYAIKNATGSHGFSLLRK